METEIFEYKLFENRYEKFFQLSESDESEKQSHCRKLSQKKKKE